MTELFSAYTAAFLRGLADYARVEAAEPDIPPDAAPPYIAVSQRLEADGSPLVVGLAACEDAFFTLAGGYSGVSLDSMEELAVDAVSELFNVINGRFSSEMRARRHVVSIVDPPRHRYGAALPADAPISRPIASPFGTMRIAAAREEFLPD